MSTDENVMAAFAGESQASRKYLFFSEKAEEEGLKNIAKLFLAASEAETIHAKKLLSTAGKIGSTEENLSAAIVGETHEFTTMYPEFLAGADKDGNTAAKTIFTFANKAEEVHAGLYEAALKAVREGKDLVASRIMICPVCGNVVIDEVPDRCPICNVPGKSFKEITL